MASVVGKWKIEHCENFEEYLKAIGAYMHFCISVLIEALYLFGKKKKVYIHPYCSIYSEN